MPAIAMKKEVQIEAKVLKVHCKVSDMFTASLVDQNGDEIFDQEDGYVPGFMPGDHYGDYVILDIDLDTGKILNWKPPTAKAIEEWINRD
ncbi:hypothetical protein [Bradyrhizobium centrolobii]|nr:hypothetical protein [Bradyrhizobium centrolobii]